MARMKRPKKGGKKTKGKAKKNAKAPAATQASPKDTELAPKASSPSAADAGEAPSSSSQARAEAYRALVQLGTSLWYLKTKHFKQSWKDASYDADDPRERRALGRIENGIDALRSLGVEVADPTASHYPTGGEALMRPIEFRPTQGVVHDTVSETTQPIVYVNGRLAQRAEVFVAVPHEPEAAEDPSPAQTDPDLNRD